MNSTLIQNNHRLSCRSCSSENLRLIWDLGYQPWGNNILTNEQIRTESYYPLRLFYCNDCTLLQLDHTVPKETMFLNHCYLSGTTETLQNHFYELAKENIKQFNLNKDDLIVDIGGNDGTQLLQYKKLGYKKVINIEPSYEVVKIATKNKINTYRQFFNKEFIDCQNTWRLFQIGNEWEESLTNNLLFSEKAKLINASGVFFHLEELHSVLQGIKKILDNDGVLIIQFMYAGMIIDKLSFDMIYHEHLCYYTLKSLINLLRQYDLEIFDAYFSEIHNGSIIAKVSHSNNSLTNSKTERYQKTYLKDNDYEISEFEKAFKKIDKHLTKLNNLLYSLSDEGKTIYALGAPVKGNTLLNTMNIGSNVIQKAFEKNKLKCGHFMPESYIPIVEQNKNDIPDYFLLLAYNFEKEILNDFKEEINSNKVKIIIPFPKIRILDHIN
ncbi:class I SAM-dependent methyltransferase [Candidatus Gracilibacteria bacterium]|jgi:SAM-dependent methyltransferase|nr:class I SAM-dependent methyltransferase [Candidatus Gracilibacteria bacterium]